MELSKRKFFQKINYVPSEMQSVVHYSNSRFRVLAAGARAGKSMLSGIEAAFYFMLPGKNIWICGTQYELAEKEFNWAIDFLNKIKFNGSSILSYCRVTNTSRGSREIQSPWASYIKTKSTEKPQTLLGEELDLLILSEASQITRVPYERMLRPRLGPRKGQLLAISTPNADSGLFNDLFQKGKKKETDWESWQYSTLANPYFSKVEYETARKELPADIFKEQYEGEFVSRRGKIFGFDFSKIQYDELDFDIRSWCVLCGVHRGYKNPFALVFVAVGESGQKIVFDAVIREEMTIETAIEEIQKKTAGMRFSGCVSDYWDYDLSIQFKKYGMLITTNESEKKIGKSLALMRRVQVIQKELKFAEEKRTMIIKTGLTDLLDGFEKSKWPEKRDEEKELPELEIPNSKYLPGPFALGHVLCFLEEASGFDPYRLG